MINSRKSKKVITVYHFINLVTEREKNQPVIQEAWVQSLGGEDPLEKGIATYSSILVWKTPQVEEPWWSYDFDEVHGVSKSQTRLRD